MRKEKERAIANSCWNKADDGERLFILLGRDVAAPAAIRAWADARIALGKNKARDNQILDALKCADIIEKELREKKDQGIRREKACAVCGGRLIKELKALKSSTFGPVGMTTAQETGYSYCEDCGIMLKNKEGT